MSATVLLAVSAEVFSPTRNYPSAIYVTTVLYSYLLNLSREIEYIWSRPWSWVSTLFVAVRYIGISWVVLDIIFVSFDTNNNQMMYGHDATYLPEAALTLLYRCVATCLIALWEYPLFLAASDFVMILRVYALWNRSKPILYSLLFIYVSELVALVVFLGLHSTPNTYLAAKSGQRLSYPQCTVASGNDRTTFSLYTAMIPRFVLCIMLLALALVRTLKESFEMYKVTKKWQPNRYVQQSVRDGIIYFVTISAWNVIQLLPPPSGLAWDMFFIFGFRLVCCMMPLFIINVREQYAKLQCQDIDTGFGVSSQITSMGHLATPMITFVDYNPGRDQEEVEGDEYDLTSSARDAEGQYIVGSR